MLLLIAKGNHLKQQQKTKGAQNNNNNNKRGTFFFSVPSNTLMGIVLSETVMYKLLNQTSSKCEFWEIWEILQSFNYLIVYKADLSLVYIN